MNKPRQMEVASAGQTFDLGAAALDAAIQGLIQCLRHSDAPIAPPDDLVAAVTGDALQAIIAARVALFTRGHDRESDDMLPIGWFAFEARQHLVLATQQTAAIEQERDLVAAENNLALSAAFCMAGIDRLRRARGRA